MQLSTYEPSSCLWVTMVSFCFRQLVVPVKGTGLFEGGGSDVTLLHSLWLGHMSNKTTPTNHNSHPHLEKMGSNFQSPPLNDSFIIFVLGNLQHKCDAWRNWESPRTFPDILVAPLRMLSEALVQRSEIVASGQHWLVRGPRDKGKGEVLHANKQSVRYICAS